jgi:hypothetical protein
MLDNDCSEYSRLPATKIDAGKGIDLYIYEDAHYVWLCYTYPDNGSLGTLDMKLKTDALAAPLNLHVSAEIGEWPADRDDLAPKNPESDIWWNNKGWTGYPALLHGMDRSGPTPRYRFKNTQARELQLGKERFGKGNWQFALTIHNIKGEDGQAKAVRFPANGSYYVLKTR